MVKADVEVVSIAARQDMRGLLKEYARLGYKETYHGSERGFDDLWRTAFPPAENEPPLPILLQYARVAHVSTDVLIDPALDLPAKPKHSHR